MQPNLNLSPSDLQNVKCENCDSELFTPAFFIKKISALVSPNGKEGFVPLQTFACSLCGHVNESFKKDIP
jgi:hypothetical protein